MVLDILPCMKIVFLIRNRNRLSFVSTWVHQFFVFVFDFVFVLFLFFCLFFVLFGGIRVAHLFYFSVLCYLFCLLRHFDGMNM